MSKNWYECKECGKGVLPGEGHLCLGKLTPFKYAQAPSCLNCHHNAICECGEFGDKGICLLYKERAHDE